MQDYLTTELMFTNRPVPQNDRRHPLLSIVIPVYNVEEYLSALFSSLDKQKNLSKNTEIIFIVDGSPDASESYIKAWMQKSVFCVKLISQKNSGVAGARNSGLEVVSGDVVTFIDPDDFIADDYLAKLLDAVELHPQQNMFVTRLVRKNSTGETLPHPLDYKFFDLNTRVINLSSNPEMIHLSGATVAFRMNFLKKFNISFPMSLRDGFEDAFFINQALLYMENPEYVIVPDAEYYYRTRSGSLVDISAKQYWKKYQVWKEGILALVDQCDQVPQWLANVALYDMYWVFIQNEKIQSPIFSLSPEQNLAMANISQKILRKIGTEGIIRFRCVKLPFSIRSSWVAAVNPAVEQTPVFISDRDNFRHLQKITFHTKHKHVDVQIFLNKTTKDIVFHHARELLFFEKTWAYEHILWIPISKNESAAAWEVKPNVASLKFLFEGTPQHLQVARDNLNLDPPVNPEKAKPLKKYKLDLHRFRYALAYRLFNFFGYQKKYKNAWTLVDRVDQANDNAEHLYDYIRLNRADINAWFVIHGNATHFKKLKARGFKVVPYGSKRHFVLMKHTKVYASSMLDQNIQIPFPKKYLNKEWIFVFLQHGVTKDLIHRWFNTKNIELLITATEPETESIAAYSTPYKFSKKEVALTGFPRHDRLFKLSHANDSNKNLLMIMPTWRHDLGDLKYPEDIHQFRDSKFYAEWQNFISSPLLETLSRNYDLNVAFLPHPRLERMIPSINIPNYIKVLSYSRDDIRKYLTRAVIAVTDYSSQGFEAAFCYSNVVYFQFDASRFFSGVHTYSKGYFDYERDGFGPVSETVDELLTNIEKIIDGTHRHMSKYRERIESLYPYRDDHASERVVEAIEKRLEHIVDFSDR